MNTAGLKNETEILNVRIGCMPKPEILSQVSERLDRGQKTFIVTPYPEFFYLTSRDYKFRDVLNSAHFSLPDGIGIIWAAYFFNLPLKAKQFYAKVLEAIAQVIVTGAEIILAPKKVYSVIPEKITGADFFWDLAKLAQDKKLSLFLLGGAGNVPKLTASKLQEKYPEINIAGYSSASASNENLVDEINESGADILMVAFGPGKQEIWIHENWARLKIKLAIGLGGTFDYVSGTKLAPPKWMRAAGLEWLFRLITQPSRIKRIWHATVSFVLACLRSKIFMTMPFRKNVVGVIINNENKVLIVRRIYNKFSVEHPAAGAHWQFPQGGVEGQDPEQAVLREMSEEVSLKNLKVLGKAKQSHRYLWNHAQRPIFFNPLKFKGQEQHIYFLKLGGNDIPETDKKEHDLYKWVSISELPEIVHELRMPLVKIVTEEISNYT